MSGEGSQEDLSNIELFEALGHPLRVKIIETLNASTLSFSDLKRKVGMESSGHLTFHLGKLGHLIKINEEGSYCLTDDGREALRLLKTLGEARKEGGHTLAREKGVWIGRKSAIVASIIVLIVVSMGISLAFPLCAPTWIDINNDISEGWLHAISSGHISLKSNGLIFADYKLMSPDRTLVHGTQYVQTDIFGNFHFDTGHSIMLVPDDYTIVLELNDMGVTYLSTLSFTYP